MALLTKIKQSGTQAGLDSTKRELDKLLIKDCFTINLNTPDTNKYDYVKIQEGIATFNFTGTNYDHKGVDIEINFKKWEQNRLPKHIKFDLDSGFLKINYSRYVPNEIKGYTFEVVDPDASTFRFDISGPSNGFDKSDYVIEDCTFIGGRMVLNNNNQLFTRQKYFILTKKGKLIKGKLDENKNIVRGLKKVLFNGTNKFDLSILYIRDFGIGIEPTEVGDGNNKWYDWIKSKYTPPGTNYTFIKNNFPFTFSFHNMMNKLVKEYLVGMKPGINIEKINIEDYLDRDNQGILYVH